MSWPAKAAGFSLEKRKIGGFPFLASVFANNHLQLALVELAPRCDRCVPIGDTALCETVSVCGRKREAHGDVGLAI
jgi:hypothetical protein